MAKRNAKKQVTRDEIESSDPVCLRLALLADEADLLLLTQGADYDTDDELSAEYDKRLAYLPVLIAELTDWRVQLVAREESRPDVPIPGLRSSPEDVVTKLRTGAYKRDVESPTPGPSAHEGSPDATDHDESE